MADTINGVPKYVVKKRIREAYERAQGELRPGTGKYADLMNTIEGQVQTVLEEERGEA